MKNFILLLCMLFSVAALAQEKPGGLFINSKAPDFKLKDQHGAEVWLKELKKKGPVVVIFYRGNWCPYCNKELKRFQDSLQFIADRGAILVAITPEGSEGIGKTVNNTGAQFSILHDADMKLSKGYAVSYEVDEKTAARYKNFGNDLLLINNQKGKAYLPVPAVYVINRDGAITYRYFDADYKKRPSVADILAQLK